MGAGGGGGRGASCGCGRGGGALRVGGIKGVRNGQVGRKKRKVRGHVAGGSKQR